MLDAGPAGCGILALGPEALGLVDVEVEHGCTGVEASRGRVGVEARSNMAVRYVVKYITKKYIHGQIHND